MFEKMIPLLAAVVSAVALLLGYIYQKSKEHEADALKYRQEIYADLIRNVRMREDLAASLTGRPGYPDSKDPDYRSKRFELYMKSGGEKISEENRRLTTLFSIYGTDAAIKAYVSYLTKEGRNPDGDSAMGDFILVLRKEEYGDTKVSPLEIDTSIYNSQQYLDKARKTGQPEPMLTR